MPICAAPASRSWRRSRWWRPRSSSIRRTAAATPQTIAVRAPAALGAYRLGLVFPRQQIGRDIYEEAALPIAFRTVAHQTSVAVWGVASPVRAGGSISATVGVKSAGGCELARARVEILDAAGVAIGHGVLGDTPWPGTGLYFAQIALAAPPREGAFSWQATFPAQEFKLAHDPSGAAFGFTTVPPPEHRLTVRVTEGEMLSEGERLPEGEKVTGGQRVAGREAPPLAGVELALGPYRTATDAAGLASLDVPAGRFSLSVWKPGFEAAPVDVEIDRELRLEVEMQPLPQEPTVWD